MMNQFRNIIRSDKATLQAAALSALNQVFSANGCTPPMPEPRLVECLVLKFVPALHLAWRAILGKKRIKLRCGGVFCHQKPKVTWLSSGSAQSKPNCVELGDLLICHIHLLKGQRRSGSAVLLQAKKVARLPHKLSSGQEEVQLELYRDYPRFNYASGNYSNGNSRHIYRLGGRPLRYLTIEMQFTPSCNPNVSVVVPANRLKQHGGLSEYLVRLLSHDVGRVFSDPPNKVGDQWSLVVRDLLRLAGTKAHPQRVIVVDNNGAVSKSIDSLSLFAWASVDDLDPPAGLSDSEEGMSVILLETEIES